MLLAINCNNTNIKFGVVDGDRIVGEWRQHTSAMRTADEHAVWLYELMRMEGIDPKSVTDAIIACARATSIASRCSSASPTSSTASRSRAWARAPTGSAIRSARA
jgi:pantothenate kinase type III